MPGLFITFEGGEGAGKSTQVAMLAEQLRATGRTVVTTREPGGTAGAEAIRALLVTGTTDRWDALTELFLLNAARRDHVQRVIRPALERGETVICDRYIDSTRVYQGIVKGLSDDLICRHHQDATAGLWPDLTLLLDLQPEQGLSRASRRNDAEARFEGEALVFHEALRRGFLELAAKTPDRFRIIDAGGAAETVAAQIWAHMPS